MVSETGLKVRMAIVGSLLFGVYLLLAQFFMSFGLDLVWVVAGLVVFVAAQYKVGSWMALRTVNGYTLTESEHPEIYRMVADLCQSMELDQPRVLVGQMGTPNAFAVGRRGSGTVVLSASLIEILEADELEGVIAHELAHLENRDSVLMTLGQSVATIIGFLVFIGVSIIGQRSLLVAIFAFVLGTIAKFVVTLLVMAMSRYREYVADDTAAAQTDRPEALASALTKIRLVSQAQPNETTDLSVSALCISRPGAALFSTHPPAERRIEALAPGFDPAASVDELAETLEAGTECPNPECGEAVDSDWNHCKYCGEPLVTGG